MKRKRAPATALRPSIAALGDLPELLQQVDGFSAVLAALRAGRSAAIDGAWGSSPALVVAALEDVARTLLVILAHPHDLDGWSDDLRSFSGTIPAIFPAWNSLPSHGDALDEVGSQRLRLLGQLDGPEPPRFLLTTFQALMQPVPERAQLRANRRRLQVGSSADLDELAGWLLDHGYRRTEVVELPGEFSRRGGIVDVYSPDHDAPARLEFFGDEIESIRTFDPQTQRSLSAVPALEITGLGRAADRGPWPSGNLVDFLPPGSCPVLLEPDELGEQGKHFLERVSDQRGLFSVAGTFQQLFRFPSVRLTALPGPSDEATCHLRIESVERFSGQLSKLPQELAGVAHGQQVIIVCHNEAERSRLQTILASENDAAKRSHGETARDHQTDAEADGAAGAAGANRQAAATLLLGRVRAGFRLVERGILLLGDQELFRRDEVRPVRTRRKIESRAIDTFLDLNEGDLVVHVGHGIARYRDMQVIDKSGQTEEHLKLEFKDAVFLYVPASKIDLVQKYVGGARTEPELSKLGGTAWQNRKARVEASTYDLAVEMIELQALRQAQPGIAYPVDSPWQKEFEAAFPYEETPDQLAAMEEIRQDMEKTRPMDRLICGDVGYGKTELAIRAAFKAVDNGRQVAVLVPTTLLADQHFRTFSQRMAEYPFVVDAISRFRTHGEQRKIVERLVQGGVDIIIGTHRLLSGDIRFKDLGLVIIDEEQRFGVEHKERLKKLRQTVDVLTLTATPIPRTLHLSLLGIRDISNLETPPVDRLAIETRIIRWDPVQIREAILRELNREGQVFFVHNRVYNIQEIADKVRQIVPEARILIGHGQMHEHELEDAMMRFVQRQADVLVATTIIESGLDIPNANTIFINQADHYGLADLHQLRGRVGRYKNRAYSYLVLDSERSVSPVAVRRLKAIEEFTELGAGFKIALRDLEIRGAGNILGTQQSGHIAAVGYELYCQLLENSVRKLQNQPLKTPLEITIDLPWPAYLPRAYVPGQQQRIEVYRRLARIRKLDKLEDFRQELRDRFGPIPEPAEWMLRLAELRLLASRWQISGLRLEGSGVGQLAALDHVSPKRDGSKRHFQAPLAKIDVVLNYRSERQIRKLADRAGGRLRIVDDQSAYLRLKPEEAPALALYGLLRSVLEAPSLVP